MTEEKYRNIDAISQSYLTLLDKHPNLARKYLDGEYSLGDNEDVKIGSAVDTILTKGNDHFDKEFEIIDENSKPTGNFLSMVKKIYNDNGEETLDEKILHYHEVLGMKRPSRDKVIDEFYSRAKPYLDQLESGKYIITREQSILINDIVHALRNNEFTAPLIDHPNVQYQFPILFNFKDYRCKGLIDIIIVDEENKTLHPIDLKITSYSLGNFNEVIFSKRYDLQADFYYTGLVHNYPDYKVDPYFRFIVESSKFPGTPLVYKYRCASSGRSFTRDNKYYKGFSELLDDHNYHMHSNRWDYKREVLENEGVIEVE